MGEGSYLNLGKYADEARALLDAIKGGAIRQMELAFESIKQTVNSEWNAIKSKANSDLSAVISRVDTETVRGDIGFTALNYNDDFCDVVVVDDKHTLPVGVSLSTALLPCFTSSLITVSSGVDPDSRPAVVQSLLTACGAGHFNSGRHFFGAQFKILKLTVTALPPEGTSDYLHLSTDYHCSTGGGLTTLFYQKRNDGDWEQIKKTYPKSSSGYYHFGVNILSDGAAIGDVIYIALPAAVAGLYWPSKHFKFNNLRNKQVR